MTKRRRLCSVCHLPGHDKRAHTRGRRQKARTRKNVFFTAVHGRPRPLRGSPGYDEYLAGDHDAKDRRSKLGLSQRRQRRAYLKELRGDGPTIDTLGLWRQEAQERARWLASKPRRGGRSGIASRRQHTATERLMQGKRPKSKLY